MFGKNEFPEQDPLFVDLYLKCDSREQFLDGIVNKLKFKKVWGQWRFDGFIDEIGTVYLETGKTLLDEYGRLYPETAPIEGWYFNVRLGKKDEQKTNELAAKFRSIFEQADSCYRIFQ